MFLLLIMRPLVDYETYSGRKDSFLLHFKKKFFELKYFLSVREPFVEPSGDTVYVILTEKILAVYSR
jgi:hypothetical protein